MGFFGASIRVRHAAIASLLALWSTAAQAAPATTVTMSFDDTLADQVRAGNLLRAHGMHATFFVNSSRVNKVPKYLTLAEIQALAQDGNEIGGHTVDHANLLSVSTDEQLREICDDRSWLLGAGFSVTSFAYPFGADTSETWERVQHCGYNSGRDIGGVRGPSICVDCAYAEALPIPDSPSLDRFHTRTPDSIKFTDTLDDLKGYILQAENHGGGWVQIVMHHVCAVDPCDATGSPLGISETTLGAFMDFLADEVSAGNVAVLTNQEVIGGAIQPAVAGPVAAFDAGRNLLQNPSLEAWDSGVLPVCWAKGSGNLDGGMADASWTKSEIAYDGDAGVLLDVESIPSGEVRFVSAMDLGECAPLANPLHSYRVSAEYIGFGTPPRFVAYTADSQHFWSPGVRQDPPLPVSPTWTLGSWDIPTLPANAAGISVGFALYGPGSLLMDAFSLIDLNLEPPDLTLVYPENGDTVAGTVVFIASAFSANGIAQVTFFVDQVPVGTGTFNGSVYQLAWDSTGSAGTDVVVSTVATDLEGRLSISNFDNSAQISVIAVPDGGLPDAGAADAGVADGGTSDAGFVDAGPPDAGISNPDGGPIQNAPATSGCSCSSSGPSGALWLALGAGALALLRPRRRQRVGL